MSDGREEREELRARIEEERRKNRENQNYGDSSDQNGAPERPDS